MPNAKVVVYDPMNDGAHFEATVISEAFVGMPLAKQHRPVMQPLKELFAGDLHALTLKTYTPEKSTPTTLRDLLYEQGKPY